MRPPVGLGFYMIERNYGEAKCRLPGCEKKFKMNEHNKKYCSDTHRIRHQNLRKKKAA